MNIAKLYRSDGHRSADAGTTHTKKCIKLRIYDYPHAYSRAPRVEWSHIEINFGLLGA